jgi:hypothetical protein
MKSCVSRVKEAWRKASFENSAGVVVVAHLLYIAARRESVVCSCSKARAFWW